MLRGTLSDHAADSPVHSTSAPSSTRKPASARLNSIVSRNERAARAARSGPSALQPHVDGRKAPPACAVTARTANARRAGAVHEKDAPTAVFAGAGATVMAG